MSGRSARWDGDDNRRKNVLGANRERNTRRIARCCSSCNKMSTLGGESADARELDTLAKRHCMKLKKKKAKKCGSRATFICCTALWR